MFDEFEDATPRSRGPGRPRKTKPHVVNEITTQEAIIEFYRKRLSEAEQVLSQIRANNGKRPQP